MVGLHEIKSKSLPFPYSVDGMPDMVVFLDLDVCLNIYFELVLAFLFLFSLSGLGLGFGKNCSS